MTDDFYPGRGDGSADAVRARMAEFCNWFGVEPIKLKVRAGLVYMTDDLIGWFQETGASIDWICFGEAKGMAATFREKHALAREDRDIVKVLQRFDDTEQGIFLDCIKAEASGAMSFDEAMADFKAKLAAHRAKAA